MTWSQRFKKAAQYLPRLLKYLPLILPVIFAATQWKNANRARRRHWQATEHARSVVAADRHHIKAEAEQTRAHTARETALKRIEEIRKQDPEIADLVKELNKL